jgi:lysophospholipase L1-like esterase
MCKRRLAVWVSLSTLSLFVLVELGLRFTLGLGTPPLLQADSTIGYLHQANQDIMRFGNRVRINGFHQRSDPLSTQPDSSVLRVLFLGDSVTWGGVLIDQANTYPEVFKVRAESACAMPVEALNASAGSWGIGNLKAYLDRFGTFDSDIVVLQIGSHDLLQETSDSSPVENHPSFPTENPWLATQELVTRYLWPRYVRPLLASSAPDSTALDSSVQVMRFDRNMNALSNMVHAIRVAGAQPLLLHTPNRNEVVAGTDGQFTSKYTSYRARFLALADSLSTPVINLSQCWRGANASANFRDSVHLTVRGNVAVGSLLAQVVKSSGLICSPTPTY